MELPIQAMNPWLTMSLSPRATIRHIITTDPRRHVILLAVLYGIAETFSRASGLNLGDVVPFLGVILLCLSLGGLGGIVSLYVGGALLTWVGQRLGGRGNSIMVRAAIAWSAVPRIWALILLPIQIAIFRKELFTSATPQLHANRLLALLLLSFALVELIVRIWSFVIFLHALGEVHGFSAWRALVTTLLAGLVILCIAIVIGILILLGIVLAR